MYDSIPLKDLTSLGLFMGRVSEVHITNLKFFPFIFFNDLKEVKLDYDIGTNREDPSFTSYDLCISAENDNLDKRYLALESSVRALFWKEMKVKISINGKEVYKSE